MNKLLGSVILLVLAFPAFGCDEACQRDRASVTHNIEFQSHLSWKFCEDTKSSFMAGDIRSLENYRNKSLSTMHRGGMNNIKGFLEQRKAWLEECDSYLALTNHGRIFADDQSTEQIFEAMASVAKELDARIKGVTYVSGGDEAQDEGIIASKFDRMFKLLEDHKVVMMRKGQFVTN